MDVACGQARTWDANDMADLFSPALRLAATLRSPLARAPIAEWCRLLGEPAKHHADAGIVVQRNTAGRVTAEFRANLAHE